MKCKFCDGSGTDYWSLNGEPYPCPVCNGTGEYEPFDADIELDKLYPTEQTNEEWLKSLNTDEFADFLEGVAFDSNFRNGIEAEYRREDKDYCYGDRPKIIKAWLKEVHK